MVDKGQAAGFVTLTARKGKIVHHRATGKRGLSVRETMPLDAIFDIASMTKPLTAVAALLLYEEGRIAWATPSPSICRNSKISWRPRTAASSRPPSGR